MSRSIRLSTKAIRNTNQIANYISTKFGVQTYLGYEERLENQLYVISQNPHRYPKTKVRQYVKAVSRCVFEASTIILFRYTERQVFILSIHDSRTNWK